MNEIQKKLDNAYNVLTRISVSGDGVDLMATAKSILRDAYKIAEDRPEKSGAKETKNG